MTDVAIEAARHSPVYRFVKQWKIALPITPQFRTLPMLFYVPPLLPVLAHVKDGRYNVSVGGAAGAGAAGGSPAGDPLPLLSSLEQARLPLAYMASLFAAGNQEVTAEVYRKLMAVRLYMQASRSGGSGAVSEARLAQALALGKTSAEEAKAIFQLSSRATYEEHFVLPPFAREVRIEATEEPQAHRQETGFGFRRGLKRRG
jgi:nitrate reductase beta subunit